MQASELKQAVQAMAAGLQEKLMALRRHLHMYPELSYEEYETQAFVAQTLQSWGLQPLKVAGTGLLLTITGALPSARCIALRADMDALPIQEANEVEYQSQRKGVMHACGHDVHTSCLLGAAYILHSLRAQWGGTVKLLFQPGEEKNPGGATLMIADGVLENPVPQAICGLHVHNGMPAGQFSFRKGRVMASADELYITLNTNGGHAAAPHQSGDLILAASHMVVALQQVVSRMNNPTEPAVLSICAIEAGNTTNVLPTVLHMKGTLRAMNETWRYQAHEKITAIIQHTAAMSGIEAKVHIDVGYPAVDNDADVTEAAWALAADYAGAENVSETELRMGAEDFGYYSKIVPGCFYRLGIRNEALGIVHQVHTPRFNVDEKALMHGAGMMAWLGMMLGTDAQNANGISTVQV